MQVFSEQQFQPEEHGHRRPERRSLALHRLVGQRLLEDPTLIETARKRLCRMSDRGVLHPEYRLAWERLLDLPLPVLVEQLTIDDEVMRDLRQSTPFAGILTQPERQQVLKTVQ